jgi:hypothetical protein
MSAETVLAYAELLAQLAKAGATILASIEQASAEMKAMQDADRDPTVEEWMALNARIDKLRAAL